jgi:hypothetical protein
MTSHGRRPRVGRTQALAVVVAAAVGLMLGPAAHAASQATEGAVFAGPTVPAPAGCAADSTPAPMVDWGDGQPESEGTCTQNPFGVNTGSHTYFAAGAYSGTAHYTSTNGPRSTAFTVQVADAPLSASSRNLSGTIGAPVAGVVAHFTDADPNGTTTDYTATIGWGDGSSSPGIVQPSGAGFDVSGSHGYVNAGSYPVSVSIADVGGSTASVSGTATVVATTTTTTTTTATTTIATTTTTTTSVPAPGTPTIATPPPGGAPPVHVAFTSPSSTNAGRTVTLDASASPPSPGAIRTYRWTVNGRQLADCAGVTSQLMTRTLPAGTDSVGLTLAGASGALAAVTHTIVVRPAPRTVAARGHVLRIVRLPAVATCLTGPADDRNARVAPSEAYGPGPGCTTQVKSGTIEAVGCLTEYQDPIQVTFVHNQRGHGGTQHVTLPDGQSGLDGVQSAADTRSLLQDVENALNPPHPRLCVDSRGNDYICSTVGNEQLPTGASFGHGGPVEAGGGAVPGVAAHVRSGNAALHASAARLTAAQSVAFAGDACAVTPDTGVARAPECLDLWVADGPVRINGIDYAPQPGGELVIAPQFNLLVSQQASNSLDGLLLNPSDPFRLVNFQLPATGATAGVDYPALSVTDLSATIKHQPNPATASAIIAALRSVGGFPSVAGLEIAFDNDTATITFHVALPSPPFSGGDGDSVTAAVTARIGPTEPFHVIYGYLGNETGGSSVDLGPVALSGFGICYRDHYSSDPDVDPCQKITNIDDSELPVRTWTASGGLNIADALNVEFRPGSNTIPGCSQAVPLGFAFSDDGGLSQAGAALDLQGSGGIPIFPGVSITGLAAGFKSTPHYNAYAGCVGLSVVDLLSITGNVFGVHTVNGYPYTFSHDELGPNVLQQTGGTFPHTDHVGIGASGVASLTLPELPAFQVGAAYALYVDDPAAVFFGAGMDVGLPHGNFEDQPGTGIALKGGLKGAIGLSGGFPFDFEGYANFEASALSQTLLSGEAELIVSYSPQAGHHGGIGACLGLGVGDLSGNAGFAYHWGDTYFDLPGDINIGSCDNNWLDRQIGVDVQTAIAGHLNPRAATDTVRVPSGLNAVNLRVHGAADAPDITVTGPGGASASTAGLPLNQIVKGPAFTLARFPTLHETIIAPARPGTGRYRITINPGSSPITKIDRLDGIRPRLSAHVTGDGTHRSLHYRFTRMAGQSVEFFEISGQVHRSLGTTVGGQGAIAFTASAGHERRQIVAEVYGDGAPRLRVPVTSYRAPSLVRLGRVRHLRVTRRGGRATVTFSAVPGAKTYRIHLTLSDGTRQMIITRKHRATFGPIFVDSGGAIAVEPIGDGLNTITGPSVGVKLAPLFGRGKPAGQRPAATPKRH